MTIQQKVENEMLRYAGKERESPTAKATLNFNWVELLLCKLLNGNGSSALSRGFLYLIHKRE
jgi:hypothetical protein